MSEVLLQLKDVTVRFGNRFHPFTAVNRVSFDIHRGETFGLVGESGSGKTTIGRAIIRIHPTYEGEILYDGQKINGHIDKALDKAITRKIQMIFQDPMASLNERAKVDYIVSEGIYSDPISKEKRREMVEEALMDVGLLPEFASRFPHEFSGGQRQRIGIARALIMQPFGGTGGNRKALPASAASLHARAALRRAAARPHQRKAQGAHGVRPEHARLFGG